MQHYIYIIGATLTWIAIALAIVHVVMDNRQPAKTMAWALVIFFLPVVGIVLYLFFGVNQRRERMVEQRSLDQLSKRSMLNFVEQHNLRVPDAHQQLVELFINQNLSLPFKDNQVDIMTDGYAFFPELLRDIAQARHHIHLDMYIFEDDALGNLVADALIDRARSGLRVRVIYDDVGCWKVRRRLFERMREEGVEIHPFLPVHFPSFTSKANYRNHRKLVVIDGRIGYIGGMNIALRYVKGNGRQAWRDTHLRIRGGAVYGIQSAFLVDWYFVDRTLISDRTYYPEVPSGIVNNCLAQIVTSNPTSESPEMMHGYVSILHNAKQYVYMTTPYFLPTETVLFAMRTCAQSGVDVRLMIPMKADAKVVKWASSSFVMQAADDGVKIYLYQSGFNHSKLLICDDSLCSCGSTNIDFRSFENNFEANVFFYDREMALRLKQVFEHDLQQCVPLDEVKDIEQRGFFTRLWESFVRLFAPML